MSQLSVSTKSFLSWKPLPKVLLPNSCSQGDGSSSTEAVSFSTLSSCPAKGLKPGRSVGLGYCHPPISSLGAMKLQSCVAKYTAVHIGQQRVSSLYNKNMENFSWVAIAWGLPISQLMLSGWFCITWYYDSVFCFCFIFFPPYI